MTKEDMDIQSIIKSIAGIVFQINRRTELLARLEVSGRSLSVMLYHHDYPMRYSASYDAPRCLDILLDIQRRLLRIMRDNTR